MLRYLHLRNVSDKVRNIWARSKEPPFEDAVKAIKIFKTPLNNYYVNDLANPELCEEPDADNEPFSFENRSARTSDYKKLQVYR